MGAVRLGEASEGQKVEFRLGTDSRGILSNVPIARLGSPSSRLHRYSMLLEDFPRISVIIRLLRNIDAVG